MKEKKMNKTNVWFKENYGDFISVNYQINSILFTGKSEFQTVEIVESSSYGKMLFNDNILMLTEKDEHVYHEMIAHVPLFSHPHPENVLIVGGGDGGTLREVLRHPQVKNVHLIEIDAMVLEACKKWIPQTSSSMEDPRANIKIEDGVHFVANTKEKFDLVIVDSSEPIGPSKPLFGKEFYGNVKNILNKDGIVIAQGESPFLEKENQVSLLNIQKELFSKVHIYNYTNCSYIGGLWTFTYASDTVCPIRNFCPKKVQDPKLDFKYYNVDTHYASFQLPEFIKKNLAHLLSPLPRIRSAE